MCLNMALSICCDFFLAFQGHLLELLGRFGVGVNEKVFAASIFAFQGHLLELLGRLGAEVSRKVFAPRGQIFPCFN